MRLSRNWLAETNMFATTSFQFLENSVTCLPEQAQQATDVQNRNMEPGGYIEQMEVEILPQSDDGTCPPDSIFVELAGIARLMHPITGRDFNISDGMKTMMEDAGFVDTVEHRLKLPLGAWSSDLRYQEIGTL